MARRPRLRSYFDPVWYAARYGSRPTIRLFPWAYHRRRGWKKGHSPHPLFDARWYRGQHPDVEAAGVDPLRHYVTVGWREGRSPHPLFDVAWYLDRYPDVRAAGHEPLLHYLLHGWRERRSPHPAFDGEWYKNEHPDVGDDVDPLIHYVTRGWRDGRSPHPLFDSRWYLDQHHDVTVAEIEPLAHFLTHGWREGRDPSWRFPTQRYAATVGGLPPDTNPFLHFLAEAYPAVAADPKALDRLLESLAQRPHDAAAAVAPTPDRPRRPGDVKAIAMYLPQFHRVAENDRWWGEGFTEWTNVRRGRPMFQDHHQPHEPHPDVGYYDLDDETVLERQAAMARRFGIHGFCFYYYWFDGRRILEKPLDRLLRSGKPDFPFCFCWANENWTRTWDGRDREVLLEQRHSPDSDERFIRDLLPALRDPRYIRIEGKPLLAVYRPGLLHDAAATARRWREICRAEGLEGIHLAAVQSFDREDPRRRGFDSAIQFPPLLMPAKNLAERPGFAAVPGFRGAAYDYRDAVTYAVRQQSKGYPLFRGVMPGWDNTARRMERGTAWVNSSPELYGRWLRAAIEQTQREHPAERQFIFINAWNEWAEGAHLEPDVKLGYRNLEETRTALATAQGGRHGAPLDATSARHPEEYRLRRNRLDLLFGETVPSAAQDPLLEHGALLAQLADAGHRLRLDDGMPVCEIAGRTLPLDGPTALAAAHDAAWPPAAERPFCFVLLQHNKPEVTARCVASLERLDPGGGRIHVVVVDNASTPENVARTRALFGGMPHVTLLFNAENLGFARGNNVGYRHAREVLGAEFVAVINNDTLVEERRFVAACREIFGRHAYSVLGPDIVTPDGRRQNPWNDYVYDAPGWRALGSLYQEQRSAYLATGRAEFRTLGSRSPAAVEILNPVLQGAAYVFSPVFTRDRAIAFDERTFLYGEEFLLATDCLLAGHPLLYTSRLKILHEEGVSTRSLPDHRKIMHGYDAAMTTIDLAAARLERRTAARRAACLAADAAEIGMLTADGRRHVLIDLLFCQPGFHGGGEYGKAVFKAVVESAASRGDAQVWAALDPALFIDDWVWQACRAHGVNLVAVKTFAEIAGLVNAGRFATFFAPAIVVYTGYEYMRRVGGSPWFEPGATRVMGAIHDLRDEQLAADWPAVAQARREAGCLAEAALRPAQWAAEAARQAALAEQLREMYRGLCDSIAIDTLVTVSDYSARVIRDRLATRRRFEVLFAPSKDRPAPEACQLPGIEADDEFALCVNAGRVEKNAAATVAAFDRLCSDPRFAAAHPRLKLVLTGIAGLDELGIRRPANPRRFVAAPHLPPARLEHLYATARILLYASFSEGFGYPPLEALAHGTPSVIADNTSIPEVCGTAAVSCDPFDILSIMRAIERALEAPPAADELAAQLRRVSERQRHDLARLVDLVCGRTVARAEADEARLARAA